MTKRPSDQTSPSPPPLKHARPSHPLDSSEQEIASPAHPLALSQRDVKLLREKFQRIVPEFKGVQEAKLIYRVVWVVLNDVVDEETFLTNFQNQQDFFEVWKRAHSTDAPEDLEALVNHSAYSFCPTNQVIIRFQGRFGLRHYHHHHSGLCVRLLTCALPKTGR